MADVSSHDRSVEANGRAAIDWEAALRGSERWLRIVIRGRVGEADAVDDVLQNVAVATLNGSHRPTDPHKVVPWLYRVTVKQCLMHRRRSGRQRRLLGRVTAERGTGEESGDNDPLAWLLSRERRHAVRAALSRLRDLDREVLVLRHTENWTYQQLADHLGVSVRTVEYRLLQARQRLRRELSEGRDGQV